MAAKQPTDHFKFSHQLGYCSSLDKDASTWRVKSTHSWDYWTNSHPILRASSPETWNCSVTKLCLFANSWTAACQNSLSFTSSQSLLKFISIESVMLSNHLILCCLLPLPSIFPSIRGFFPMSWLFPLDGQHIGAFTSVLPVNIQGWFPLRLTVFTYFQSKGISRVFSRMTIQNH